MKPLPMLALCALISHAAAAPATPLDRARVHADYRNGDFEKVIRGLEALAKSGRRLPRADSVFAAKHLAVVYAANPATRELGRYHMLRLLELAPDADLIDMFVGEEVDAVFAKVSKEYAVAAQQGRLSAPRALPPAPRPVSAPPAPRRVEAPRAAATRAPPAPMRANTAPAASAAAPSAVVPSADHDGEWKGAAKWIGGGAAIAVLGLTLYFASSDDGPAHKTYAVPAQPTP